MFSDPFALVYGNVCSHDVLTREFEKLICLKLNLFCNEGDLRWKIVLKISVPTFSDGPNRSLVSSKIHIITNKLHFLKVGAQISKKVSQEIIFVSWRVTLKKEKDVLMNHLFLLQRFASIWMLYYYCYHQ